MQADYQIWILVGSQVLTAGALFLQLNSKIDSLSKEINELKIEQAKMEARIEGKLGILEGRLSSLEQTVRYILDCFPKPKIFIQKTED